MVVKGVPHFPQKRSPGGTSAPQLWHLFFSTVAQLKHIGVSAALWKPQWGQSLMGLPLGIDLGSGNPNLIAAGGFRTVQCLVGRIA